jgi:hypothetical protein
MLLVPFSVRRFDAGLRDDWLWMRVLQRSVNDVYLTWLLVLNKLNTGVHLRCHR